MTPPRPVTYVRCRFYQAIRPGWLPIPDVPNGALLLHHLGAMHRAELTPWLQRMATEDIGTMGCWRPLPSEFSGRLKVPDAAHEAVERWR
jgi:hypothetical protein